MTELKLMIIKTELPCLAEIDRNPAGESIDGLISFPYFGRRALIGLVPLANPEDAYALPLYRILDFEELNSKVDSDFRAYAFGSDIIYIEAKPPLIKKEVSPYVIASLELKHNRTNAIIYYDRAANLIIEDQYRRILYAKELDSLPNEAKLSLYSVCGQYILAAELSDSKKKSLLLVQPSGDFSTIYYSTIHNFELNAERIRIFEDTDDPYGMSLCRVFSFRESSFKQISCEYMPYASSAPPSLFSTARSLILAVRNSAEGYALSLLSDELRRDISFSDLKDFFGGFSAIINELSSENEPVSIALAYDAEGRIQKFSFKGEFSGSNVLISDIDEA